MCRRRDGVVGQMCGRRWLWSWFRGWGIEHRRRSEVLHARGHDGLARLKIFQLPLQLFVRLFLRASHLFLPLLLLLCDVMPVIAFATGLRAHRATGEIKQDGGGEQKEQGFLKHAA